MPPFGPNNTKVTLKEINLDINIEINIVVKITFLCYICL